MIPKNELRFLPREWKLPRLDCCYTNKLSALILGRMLVRASQALQLTCLQPIGPRIPRPTVNYARVKYENQHMRKARPLVNCTAIQSFNQVSRQFLIVAMPTDGKLKLPITTMHHLLVSSPAHHKKCQLFPHSSNHLCTHLNLGLQEHAPMASTSTAPAPCPAPPSCSGGPSSP